MKHYTLIFLTAVLPSLIFCQPYTNSFTTVNGATDKQKQTINTTSSTIKLSDGESMINAKIRITDVASSEEAKNLILTEEADDKKLVAGKYDAENKILEFELSSIIEEANGKFQLFYKDISQGIYQFTIDKSKNGDGSSEDDTEPEEGKDDLKTYVGLLANANFAGNNKFLSNLTPIVTLGGIVKISKKFSLDINPYLGSEIDTKDSSSFIPALMLPGRAGLILNSYLTFGTGDASLILMPFGFGLKLIPNVQDSNTIIWQHNIRTGIAFRYSDIFIIGAQYTHGWHNTTSESGRFFSKVFGNEIASEIDYITVSGQFSIKGKNNVNNYLYLEWRGLQSKKRFSPFTNNSIITLGFRKDISVTGIFPASSKGKSKRSKTYHMSL